MESDSHSPLKATTYPVLSDAPAPSFPSSAGPGGFWRNRKHPLRRTIRWIRRLSLLTVLVGAAILVKWNNEYDPRFYLFANSPVGRILFARIAPGVLNGPLPTQDNTWTEPERHVKKMLEQQQSTTWPTHRLRLRNGQVALGRVISQDQHRVVFAEHFRSEATFSKSYATDQVDQLAPYPTPPPDISLRDVRFQMEKPDMALYRRPPYTMVTDQGFFGFDHAVSQLDRLHDQFLERFEPLIDRVRQEEHIQVLFFAKEEDYRAYQKTNAAGAEHAVGYYLRHLDRLVFFDYMGSASIRDVHEAIDLQVKEIKAKGQKGIDPYALDREERRIRGLVNDEARAQTYQILRHEGAHQLFFTYGIHSSHMVENTWLVEGLAVWMENEIPERVNRPAAESVREAAAEGRLFDWSFIISHRDNGGFGVLNQEQNDDRAAALAYAQSWTICYLLMQPENRSRFFEYIQYLRHPSNLSAIRQASRPVLLAEHMGWTTAELIQRLDDLSRSF